MPKDRKTGPIGWLEQKVGKKPPLGAGMAQGAANAARKRNAETYEIAEMMQPKKKKN